VILFGGELLQSPILPQRQGFVIDCFAADIFWHFMDRAGEGVRSHNYYLNVCDFAIIAVPDHDVSQAISDRDGFSIPA